MSPISWRSPYAPAPPNRHQTPPNASMIPNPGFTNQTSRSHIHDSTSLPEKAEAPTGCVRLTTPARWRDRREILGCGAVGVTLMECGNGPGRVLEVCRGFPGAFVRSVALPMKEVLDLSMPDARVQDLLHFPFHIIINLHWRRGWLYSAREAVLVMRF